LYGILNQFHLLILKRIVPSISPCDEITHPEDFNLPADRL
jgi:hypothetical protein